MCYNFELTIFVNFFCFALFSFRFVVSGSPLATAASGTRAAFKVEHVDVLFEPVETTVEDEGMLLRQSFGF